MGDLGDLGPFLKQGSIANLDWLDVNEEDYRALDTLPQQNLDIQPDLEALWSREDKPATGYLVPNSQPVESFPGAGEVHTMGDLSEVHGHLRAKAEDIRKVARLALMQSPDPRKLRDALVKRFDFNSLQANRPVLAEVLQERGLLGKLYISASDFPSCATGSAGASSFVRRFASEAKYVVAKTACGDCQHAHPTVNGGTNCAVFHKQIEMQVPYSPALAAIVENSQRAKGRAVQASTAEPKERIRLAMLAPEAGLAPAVGVYQGQGVGKIPTVQPMAPALAQEKLVQASDLVRKKQATDQDAIYARPVIDFLRREMIKGHSVDDLSKALRLAFNPDDLKRTQAHWAPIAKEAGLYGVVYSTQDSFDECRVGADFFAKHNPGVRAIVAGEKCGSCIYSKISRCLMYGKPLVREASALYTPETVEAVLGEHRTAGRLPSWDKRSASTWGETPRQALKEIHQAVTRGVHAVPVASERLGAMVAFVGNTPSHVNNSMTTREIVKQASRYMNEGLYGRDLLSALKSRFDPRDLVAAQSDLRPVIAEQGLQGIYYVDPTVYADYGRGCDEASSLHRSRVVEYVKLGSKCGDCVLQSRVGFCSKINKPLVVDPPYADKTAQQREILASGPSTDISLASLVNNGASMMTEYQMQNGGMEIELNEVTVPSSVEVVLARHKVKL